MHTGKLFDGTSRDGLIRTGLEEYREEKNPMAPVPARPATGCSFTRLQKSGRLPPTNSHRPFEVVRRWEL